MVYHTKEVKDKQRLVMITEPIEFITVTKEENMVEMKTKLVENTFEVGYEEGYKAAHEEIEILKKLLLKLISNRSFKFKGFKMRR